MSLFDELKLWLLQNPVLRDFQSLGVDMSLIPLADLGGVPGARPRGSRFFHFDIQNFRNVTTSGVHGPSTRSTPPLTGNPGSATESTGEHPHLELNKSSQFSYNCLPLQVNHFFDHLASNHELVCVRMK